MTGLAAVYLREEPDALRSARPGPSGGYPVRGIPTGSFNKVVISLGVATPLGAVSARY